MVSITPPDFVGDSIQGSTQVLTVGGACSVRDEAYALQTGAQGILVGPGADRLSSPYCIGIVAEIASDNDGSIIYFLDSSSQEIGGITLTSTEISITVRGASTSFPIDATGERYFQICSDGTQLQLYDACSVIQTEPFEDFTLADTDMITLYRNPFNTSSVPFRVIITSSPEKHL